MMMTRFLVLVIGWWALLLAAWGLFTIMAAPPSHADMCGPSALPVLSYLNPYVKGCNIWVPFVPGVSVPVIPPPANAPAPIPGIGGAGGLLPSQYPWGVNNPIPYAPAP